MKYLLHRVLDVFLILNRSASKLEFGPLYLLDWFILITVLIYPLKLLKALLYFWPVSLFLFFSLVWLIVDCSNSCVSDAFRRSVLGFYFIIPAVLVATRYRLDLSSKVFYFYVFLAAASLVFYEEFDYLRISLLAEFSGLLLIFTLFTNDSGNKKVLTLFIVLLFMASVFHPSLIGSGGIYKTPLAAFILSLAVIFFGRYLIPLITNKVRFSLKQIILTSLVFVVVSISLVATSPGRLLVGEMVQGVGGIFGAESIAENVGDWVGKRERASSYGTAESRVYFWKEIFKYSSENTVRVLIGNGYEYGFMEVTDVGCIFPDCEHIEPHNSIVGIFFRYGILGVALFLMTLIYVIRFMQNIVDESVYDRTLIWATMTYGLVFINFEVALESPHGAVLFWVIIMSPIIIQGRRSV